MRTDMPRKRYKPEEIVARLRQVDVLVSQGQKDVLHADWRRERNCKTNSLLLVRDCPANLSAISYGYHLHTIF
jgi:hypothetical protein